eukprot:m.207400 g.207400  ORF g.207400 m.207400 type:complete len:185 (-) comp17788_c0_seq2:299-853(-)
MVVLTEEMALKAAQAERLQDIRILNCWGAGLTDVSLLKKMPDIEVLSLSGNCLTSLKSFTNCLKLSELYLRKNDISSMEEIAFLTTLPNLRCLWLSDNPIASLPDYRGTIIRMVPGLTKLDNLVISTEERQSVSRGTEVNETPGKVLEAITVLLDTLNRAELKILAAQVREKLILPGEPTTFEH